ncbi:hypothetical protein AWB65_06388 [Caballeronia humi]|uniref:Uncharacterized protein n=1 Tax=Caballeronia humi TaxID=326474 RepID=A0A158JEB6_9BURK|nr:hypothetical protein AWB65_06388 [Caballeronia humi]
MPIRKVSASEASAFVRDADIPTVKRDGGGPITPGLTPPSFDAAKDEQVVVGSGIVSFKSGMPQNRREAITNSLLLAQLVLKKKGLSPEDGSNWFHEYASVLANLGWLVETSEMSAYVAQSDDVDVHKAIIAVAGMLLGPAAQVAALPLIKTTLDALGSMDASTPWITLFNRESKTTNATSFQLALAQPAEDPQRTTVSMMAFSLNASMNVTQVLFFKLDSSDVTLRRVATTAEINTSVLDSVQDALRQKVSSFTVNYLSELSI